MDECAGGPCLNGGTCVDKVAGYVCLCLDMHAGPNCQYPRTVTRAVCGLTCSLAGLLACLITYFDLRPDLLACWLARLLDYLL